MKKVVISLFWLASLIFAGCASGPSFSGPVAAPNDQAVVYVYVTHSGMIPRPAQDIYVNGDKVARVPPGGYFIYHSNPGELLFTDEPTAPAGNDRVKALRRKTILALTVQRGQVYFVERVYIMGVPKGLGSFLLRDRLSALGTLSDSIEVGPAVSNVVVAAPPPPPPVEQPVVKADVVRAMQVVVEKKHYDSIMTEDADVAADTAEEKAEVDGLIAFLKGQKENRDFDQIAKIEFVSAGQAKIGFLWYGGKHVGTLAVVKDSSGWKITSESHTP